MILLIFGCLSALFLFLSFRIKRSKKPVNLWANDKSEIIVSDIKAYNSACARLLSVYAVLLFLEGILISFNHIACIIIGYLAVIFSSLALMIVYTLIESKYKTVING